MAQSTMERMNKKSIEASQKAMQQMLAAHLEEEDNSDDEKDQDLNKRDWNTVDFMGKYHLSKFKNKETSLPGTQVQVERDYAAMKAQQAKDWEESIAARTKRTNEKLRVKGESAEVNTRIYFDTIVGQPMDRAEEILNERDHLLNDPVIVNDSKKDIEKFFKNIALGRHHYVGFAASAGFQSLSYPEHDFGNTPLHIAVKKGHVAATEELLKYKADMDAVNRLGNRPLHEAWFFWKTHALRTKEERLAQEATTCDLLLKLLSYGACPDSQDQSGQTALHIASRLGPTKAVTIILSFQANTQLKTQAGLTALDVAAKHGQEESFKLLQAWARISHQLVQVDFHAIWHKFLRDYTQVISSHKSAEAILAEIEMSSSVLHMQRSGSEAVQIEDPLLRAAYEASRLSSTAPKPWEPEWASFVKTQQSQGMVDLKTQLDNLQRTRMGLKVKKGNVGGGKSFKAVVHKADSKSPDKPTPTARPRLLLPTVSGSAGASASASIGFSIGGSTASSVTTESHKLPYALHYKNTASPLNGPAGTAGNSSTDTHHRQDVHADDGSLDDQTEQESEQVIEKDVYAVRRTDYGEIVDFAASELGQRRLHLAHKVALDAKFLTFTKRLTTSSSLHLPLRTPHAPHVGTEEEGDRMRAIVSQGPDYEKFEKYKQTDKFAEMIGLRPEPKKNTIGQYSEECAFSKPTDRDLLYDRLVPIKVEIQQAASATSSGNNSAAPSRMASRAPSRAPSRPGTSDAWVSLQKGNTSSSAVVCEPSRLGNSLSTGKAVIEVEKRDKMDLVKDKRPRYVAPDLLPAIHTLSLVEKMSREESERQKLLLRKKQGLGTEHGVAAARSMMEEAIGQSQGNSFSMGTGIDEANEVSITGVDGGAVRRKLAAEKTVALKKLFLHKEVPKYGEGRITTTHNTIGKIEEPWTTVQARYSTKDGDRTA